MEAEVQRELSALEAAESSAEMVEPSVNEEWVSTLGEMGVPRVRAVRALHTTKNSSIEVALEWLELHQDDPDIDTPLLVSSAQSEFAGLTQAEKVAKLQEKIAAKRAEKAAIAKAEAREREIQRREEGKAMVAARDEWEATARKLEREKQQREKEAAAAEKERLRRQLAQDRLERLEDKYGGIEHVPEDQRQALLDIIHGKATSAAHLVPPETRINNSLEKMHSYGTEGKKALSIVQKLISNLQKDPTNDTFKSINLENKVLHQKVTPVPGAIGLLVAAGFLKVPGEQRLEFSAEVGHLDLALERIEQQLAK